MALSAEIASLFVSIGAKSTVSDDLTKAEGDVTKKTTGMSKTAKAGMLGVSAGIAAIGAGVVLATSQAADYESKMAEVFTLLPNMSKDAQSKMSDDVLALSSDIGVTTDEVVPALYQAISAGVPVDNVFDFITTANQAAIGGVTDLETAVDGITSVTNAYGTEIISAAEASDLMFTAVRLGKTTFGEMSNSLYNVIPTASALGVGFEDITASLAAMTAQGTPTTVATTQLRQALVEMSKDGSKASDSFKEVAGVGFADFIAQGGNLQDALGLLSQKADDSGIAINDLFGSVEAGNAVLALTSDSGAAAFSTALEEMGTATGATGDAADTMMDTAAYTMQQLQVEFSNLVTELGNEFIPILKDEILPLIKDDLMPLFKDYLIPILKLVLDGFGDLPTPVKILIGVIGGIVAAIAPLMLILGPFVPIITTVLPVAFAALTGPIGLVIAAIGLIVIAGKLLYDNWDAISAWLGDLWDGIVSTAENVFDMLLIIWSYTPLGIVTSNWDKISDGLSKVWNYIIDNADEIIDILKTLWSYTPLGMLMDNWGTIVEYLTYAWRLISNAASAVSDMVIGYFRNMWNGVKSIINFVIDGINSMVRALNSLSFTVPDWVPMIGGAEFGFNLSTIPKLAEGGTLSSSGSVLVGEEGPEILNLPSGASVTPMDKAGGDIYISGNTFNVRSDNDIKLIATELYSMIDKKNRSRGIGV